MTMGRGAAWEHFGAPTDQVGSVNDPRTTEEFVVKYNEKWIYRRKDQSVSRIVLWLRYDLVGAFEIAPDGSATPIPLPEAFAS
jgi:hypothetical protein